MDIIVLSLQLYFLLWTSQNVNSQTDPTTKYSTTTFNPYRTYKTVDKAEITAKETGAILQMTIEFLRDMDMKLRDVNRVEEIHIRAYDFGAGKLYFKLESLFTHMQELYKNVSETNRLMGDDIDLRSDIVGSLQFMLSDYMEYLSVCDVYKERYAIYQASSRQWEIQDLIVQALTRHGQYPYRYEKEGDESEEEN